VVEAEGAVWENSAGAFWTVLAMKDECGAVSMSLVLGGTKPGVTQTVV